MTVVNYSVQDTFGNNQFFWIGVDWFQDLLDPRRTGGRFFEALWRKLLFSAIILADRDPARHRRGARHAARGLAVAALPGADGAAAAHPVERRRHDLADLRAAAISACSAGASTTSASTTTIPASPLDAWVTIVVMDVWHWTSLVALLCYAGLQSIPDAYYQAARIDGASRWAVFRYIQLPKMRRVLLIAMLLRFMDSFMIYTEPFVLTGGGPGNATTFLSIDLVKLALGQFDLGTAAAISHHLLPDHPAASAGSSTRS